jgi:uncharacterized protein with NRDE domain
MCLILVAWKVHPEFPLIVAANRDEFHARPAASAAFWPDQPDVLAGRDLEARGTWMGVSRDGRFAAVTNFRGAFEPRAAESRGALVTRFLQSDGPADAYMAGVWKKAASYSGFNLLASDGPSLWWMSNRGGEPRSLDTGIHGLGNALLDTPELDEAKSVFAETIAGGPAVDSLFGVLAARRILNPQYGTRCSTVLRRKTQGLRYAERSFGPAGEDGETLQFDLQGEMQT